MIARIKSYAAEICTVAKWYSLQLSVVLKLWLVSVYQVEVADDKFSPNQLILLNNE